MKDLLKSEKYKFSSIIYDDIYNVMSQILNSARIDLDNFAVKIIPEEDFGISKQGRHRIEDYLLVNDVDYYFEGERFYDSEAHYEIDLRQMEINYDSPPENFFRNSHK